MVSVRSRPNGLPIAIVGSPTCTPAESPSSSGRRSRPVGIHAQEREVGVGVLADRRRGDRVVVGERHPDLGRRLDDVRVGEDQAVVVEHEARAGRLGRLRVVADVERRRVGVHRLGADEDDAGRAALVDLARARARCRRLAASAGAPLRGDRRADDGDVVVGSTTPAPSSTAAVTPPPITAASMVLTQPRIRRARVRARA